MLRWLWSRPAGRTFDVIVLVLRLALGVIMFAHGAQKAFGWFGGPGFGQAVADFATGLGIPPLIGTLVILAEVGGGICLLLGLLTRPAALAILLDQVGAALLVHLGHGFFINWQLVRGQGHGVEMSLALVAMALALVLGGSGAWGVDAAFDRRR